MKVHKCRLYFEKNYKIWNVTDNINNPRLQKFFEFCGNAHAHYIQVLGSFAFFKIFFYLHFSQKHFIILSCWITTIKHKGKIVFKGCLYNPCILSHKHFLFKHSHKSCKSFCKNFIEKKPFIKRNLNTRLFESCWVIVLYNVSF